MVKKAPKKPKNSSGENSFKAIFEDKSTVSVVVATLILLLLSFFSFRYFGSSSNVNNNINGEGASDIVVNNDQSGGETQTEESDENGQVASAETEQAVVEEQKPIQEVTPTVSEEQKESSKEALAEGENKEGAENNADQNQSSDKKGLKGFLSGIFAGKKGSDDTNINQGEKTLEDQPEGQKVVEEQTTKDNSQVLSIGGKKGSYDASNWKANDYEPNSKTGDTYTVHSGDTLWEVAEAFYGNGADWVKIAQANNVGYLANGAPLIHSGNVLTIPH